VISGSITKLNPNDVMVAGHREENYLSLSARKNGDSLK
jgi:hypothetical protein